MNSGAQKKTVLGAKFFIIVLLCSLRFPVLGQTIDHFGWSPVATPQQIMNGFFSTITAYDIQNNPFTNFNGTASISVIESKSSAVLITEIDTQIPDRIEFTNLGEEPCNISGWQISLYDSLSYPEPKLTFVIPSNTICPPKTPFKLSALGMFPGSFPDYFTGSSISWTNSTTGNPIAVLLRDNTGKPVDFFSATTGFPSPITNPITIPASEWIGLPVSNNTDTKKTYQRIGKEERNSSLDWVVTINSIGALNSGILFPYDKGFATISVSPEVITFTNGVWSGNVAINSFSKSLFLRADDLNGHPGDSNPFSVLDVLGLQLQIPTESYEASPGIVGQGTIQIRNPLATNITISLSSSLPDEIAVPPSVTIFAGNTNATFSLTNFDDALIDGTQYVEIAASPDGYTNAVQTIKNFDNEFNTLLLDIPANVQESATSLIVTGRVTVSTPVSGHFMINLSCNRSNEIQIPPSVLLSSGQTSAAFNINVIDDTKLNGPRIATISASFPGWNSGHGQINILDNESTNLSLTIPSNRREGDGVLTNAGMVRLFAVPISSVTVSLLSSNTTELQVPPEVTIPSGQTTAVFNVTVIDDEITDGTKVVPVVATSPGLSKAQVNITVHDNDVHHFQFSPIFNPQAISRPFTVTISAVDINGVTIGSFNGTANLSGSSPTEPVFLEQASVLQFTNGVWSGLVSIASEIQTVSLICDDQLGQTGSSIPFDVFGRIIPMPNSDLVYDPVTQKLYAGALNSYGTNGGSVISINPQTGQLSSPLFLQNEPGQLAVSDNGQYLYVGMNTTGGVARVNLSSNVVDQRFSFGADGHGPFFAEDMEVLPGSPTSLVASLYSFSKAGIALFANGILRTNVIDPVPWNTSQLLEVTDNPNLVYAVFDRGIRKIAVSSGGLTDATLIWDQIYGGEIEFADGVFYGTTGQILSTNNFEVFTNFPTSGILEPVGTESRIYFVGHNGTKWQVRVFDKISLADLGTINIPSIIGTPASLVYCGSNTLALGTLNEIVLFGSLPAPQADLSVAQTVSPNPAVYGSNLVYSITVSNLGPNDASSVVLTNAFVTGLDFVSAITSQGTALHQNGLVTVNLGLITNGGKATINLVSSPRFPGIAVNSIGVSGSIVDLNPANNLLTETVAIPTLETSNAVTRLNLPANDLIYDPVTEKIYVSVPATGGAFANTVTVIDPETLTIGPSHPIGHNPGKMTIAQNGRHLYVALDGESKIRSFDTVTELAGTPFSIGASQKVFDMEVLQGTTNTVIVSKFVTGWYDYSADIYDNGVPRPNTLNSIGSIEPSGDPSKIYGLLFSQFGGGFLTLSVTPSGLVITNANALGNLYVPDFEFENGLVYIGTAGSVLNPITSEFLQSYPGTLFDPIVRPDATNSKVFFLSNDGKWFLQENDLNSRALLKFIDLSPLAGKPANLIRWGTNGLAFCTEDGAHLGPSKDQIFIIRFPELPLLVSAELAISQSISTSNGVVGSNLVYTVVVTNNGPDTATNVVVADTLPLSAEFVAATVSQGTFTNSGNTVTFDVGVLTNGGSYTALVTISPTLAGLNTNVAVVNAAQNDYFASNNHSILINANTFASPDSLLRQLSFPVTDIIYDPVRDQIYAGSALTNGQHANSIVTIDRSTGEIKDPIFVGVQSGKLAISDNAQYLYLALATGGVARINLSNSLVDLRFPLAPGASYYASDLEVLPGSPGTVAVSVGSNIKVALYDNGIERSNSVPSSAFGGVYSIEFSNATNLYSAHPFSLRTIAVSTNGLNLVSEMPNLVPNYDTAFELDGGLLFFEQGRVVNPTTQTILGTYPVRGLVAPDTANQETYFLTQAGNAFSGPLLTLRGFDQNTFTESWSLSLPSGMGAATRLIQLGTNGLAFCTDAGRVVIIRTHALQPDSADIAVSFITNSNSISLGGTVTYTATVRNNGNWTASNIIITTVLTPGLSFNSASTPQGSFSETNGTVTFAIGSLTNGALVSLNITATATNIGVFTNTISATHGKIDGISTNNSATTVTTVTPKPFLSVSDIAIREGNGPGNFTIPVLLSAPSSQSVTVQYRITNGTAIGGIDFNTNGGMSGTVTFTPGSTNRTIFVSGGLIGNTIVQSNRYFYVNLTNATNASISKSQGVCWIVDDDFYQLSVAPVNVVEGNSGFTDATFTVKVSPSNALPVTVQYQTMSGSASSGSDYVAKSGSLSFPTGITNRTVTVAVKGDTLFETDESFTFKLMGSINALIMTNEVNGLIMDDDVVQPLAITLLEISDSSFAIEFDSIEDKIYRIQRSDSLTAESWTTFNDVIGTGNSFSYTNLLSPEASQEFYRVILLP